METSRIIGLMLTCGYIAFFTGMAYSDIGTITSTNAPHTLKLPIGIFCIITVPAILGYIAGNGD